MVPEKLSTALCGLDRDRRCPVHNYLHHQSTPPDAATTTTSTTPPVITSCSDGKPMLCGPKRRIELYKGNRVLLWQAGAWWSGLREMGKVDRRVIGWEIAWRRGIQ